MKKLAIVLLAALLALGSSNVYAGSVTLDSPTDYSIGVYARVVPAPDSYSVAIKWGELRYTLRETGSKYWDTDAHRYVVYSTAEWTAEGNSILVENHSNVEITASFSYTPDSGYERINASFTKPAFTLPSAEGSAIENPPNDTTELVLSGSFTAEHTEYVRVGSVSVSIS